MTDSILSDSDFHTIYLTPNEYKKHQRLLYIGSVMSQFLRQSHFIDHGDSKLAYYDALLEIAQFLKYSSSYSDLWDELAFDLKSVYDAALKPGNKMKIKDA